MERYSDDFIQQIKSRVDIADVIGSYVSIQKKGRDYWCCCPFHTEKTPSFQIKEDHQYYICYGCHKKGDIFTFVMEMDRISFNEAIEQLAKRAGLELPEKSVDKEYVKRKQTLEKIYNINKTAALFYFNNLKKPEGEVALEYFAQRGLTKETITKFGMGYSTNFDSLVEHLKQKGYSVESMREAGVVSVMDDGRVVDFFGKRIIIPIISMAGKVIGFTGRSLEAKPNHAKYKNTSTTLAFNKRKNLFGVNMFKNEISKFNGSMILVEGHMDVISLYQYGIRNVVASMGTALTPEQCKEIKRLADVVYVSYDGDSAGQNATLKGLSLLKNEGLEVKVVQLTDNLDPDDYVKKFGKEGYLKLVDAALPLVDFKLKKIEEKYTLKTYDEKVKYVKDALEVLNELDNVEKLVYVKKVSDTSGLTQEKIAEILNKTNTVNEPELKPAREKKTEINANTIAGRYVLASMIFGKSYAFVGDVEENFFESEAHKKIYNYIMQCAKESTMPKGNALFDLTDEEDASAILEALDQIQPDNQASFYKQSVDRLRIFYADNELKKLVEELKKAENEEQKNEIKKKIIEITKIKKGK